EAETHTKRGPKNASRDHFHPPIPVKHGGKKRWEFKCKHCTTSLTVERTITKDQSYDDEPAPQPSLCNLATHLKKHGGPNIPVPGAAVPGETRGISAASARIMDEFLRDGQLNPAKVRTQRGFLKVFTAWLVEDDLPFTTGETGGIQRLFEYMQSRFMLPSDTIALDNAPTNDVLIRVLSKILTEKFDIQFVPENSQIHCLAHVVNIVVQKILATLNEADDPDIVDYYLPNKDLPFHYDPAADPDLRDLENERFTTPEGHAENEEDAEADVMTELAEELASLSPLQKAGDLSNYWNHNQFIS
ncbi:hypothetical protein DFH07DRAFT_748536, partial [Mycena maculata]